MPKDTMDYWIIAGVVVAVVVPFVIYFLQRRINSNRRIQKIIGGEGHTQTMGGDATEQTIQGGKNHRMEG